MGNWETMYQQRTALDRAGMDFEKGAAVCSELTMVKVNIRPKMGGLSFDGGPCVIKKSIKSPNFTDTAFFCVTSKMNTFSFSLPAGPQKYWGTCRASELRGIEPGGVKKPEGAGEFICSKCYASGGNYALYWQVSSPQMARLLWVLAVLKEGIFVSEVVKAIRFTLSDELTSMEKFKDLKLNTNYFRLHDSGDFFDPNDYGIAMDRFAYYDGWCEIARQLPEIRFWAPTRMHIFPEWRRRFIENQPSNLTVRPSQLWVDVYPPMITGMAAGSGVASVIQKRVRDPVTNKLQRVLEGFSPHAGAIFGGTWCCPAYFFSGHSCDSAHCRLCWDQPQKPVCYPRH
jgi:hypothetical protein